MRNIKFRAWDKISNKMSRAFGLFGEFTMLGGVNIWQERHRGILEDGCLNALNDLVILQYTGLKDADGTEIYEGDMINWLGRCWDIIWDESDSSFLANSDGGECESGQEWSRECKVIGNIYENPEFME